jgi:hypothetical protein
LHVIRTPRFLQIVGVNSVPVAGVFWAEWAAATALALYWCESVMVIGLVGTRIWLHRRATNKRGHLDGSALGAEGKSTRPGSTFLREFLTAALVFTGAHAVFLAAILFLMLPTNFPEVGGVDFEALRQGVSIVAVILGVGFVIDVVRIRDRSFWWLRQMAGRVMGRVILVHMTIIFGMMATAWFDGPRGIFIVFAAFKLIADVGTFLVGDDLPDPEASPAWLAILRSVGGDKWANGYADFKREIAEEERRRAANWEKPIRA